MNFEGDCDELWEKFVRKTAWDKIDKIVRTK